jgi:hypothetical protein
MQYDATPDLLKLIDQLPKVPFSVSIETRTGASRQKAGTLSVITKADGTVQLRTQKPTDTQQDRLDFLYEFRSQTLVATDRLAHEYLRRSVLPSATWDRKLVDLLGTSRDPILLVLDRSFARSQMKVAAKQGTWSRSKTSDGFVYRNSLGRFFTADRTGRLVGISVGSGSGLIQYSYNWAAKTSWVSPLLAPDYLAVSSFVQKRPLPASDSETEEAIRQTLRAHQRFSSGTIETDGILIALKRPAIGETGPGVNWSYDGTRLSIKATNGKYLFRQSMRRDEVLPALVTRGITVNPYTRNLLNRQIPFRDFFTGLPRMRTLGKMGSGSQAMTIIQATGPGKKLTLSIGADSLVRESEYTLQTSRGPITSNRKFRYSLSAPKISN